MRVKRYLLALLAILAMLAAIGPAADPPPLGFAILGDRTGEAQAGVFEQVSKELDAERPDFVVTVGDTIEGLHDETAEPEWQGVEQLLRSYKKYPLYLAPGNLDIWSAVSE